MHIFHCMSGISKGTTQSISLIHWKIWFLYKVDFVRALRFKSSYVFLKRPLVDCAPIYNPSLQMTAFRDSFPITTTWGQGPWRPTVLPSFMVFSTRTLLMIWHLNGRWNTRYRVKLGNVPYLRLLGGNLLLTYSNIYIYIHIASKTTGNSAVCQQLDQPNRKKSMKALHYWPV